ncbi:COP9 signalosome complex subunit [Trifolium repens]|nr:COP9 signalosome complex subunit [Trifolium repens]
MFISIGSTDTDQLEYNFGWDRIHICELTANVEEELQDLQQIIFDVALVGERKDNWRWIPENSGLRVFGWRLLLEKLPTRAALASRGNGEHLPQLVPDQILKLKQLTVLTLAETYKELDVTNVRELEDFLINE